MTPALRAAAAHVLVDDVEVPALDDAASHHVFRVLRVRDGESITVTDGAGSWRACVAAAGSIQPSGPPQYIGPPSRAVTVACAVPKQDRPEWIVQKLTELGVSRIVLLHADRSVVRWTPDRAVKHLVKLRRVATEALQQSRGVWIPQIDGPTDARTVLPGVAAAEPGGGTIEQRHTAVAIGPEGGWSPDELAAASDTVSLGSTILRVETAAIVAGARLIGHAP